MSSTPRCEPAARGARQWLALLALPLVLCSAWAARALELAPDRAELARERGLPPSALAFDATAAWRVRATELALATGSSPRWDTLIGAPDGSAVPWPPGLPFAAAALFERMQAWRAGELAEPEVAELCRRLPPLLAGAAAAAVFAAARAFGAAPCWALLAALAYALWVVDGRAGDFAPGPLVAALGLASAGALARARGALAGTRADPASAVDGAGFALVAGLLGAAACASDPSAVPLFAVGILSFAPLAAARGPAGRDALRVGLLALAGAALPALALAAGALAGERAALDPTSGLPKLWLWTGLALGAAQLGAWLDRRPGARAHWHPGARAHGAWIALAAIACADAGLRAWLAELWARRAFGQSAGLALGLACALLALGASRLAAQGVPRSALAVLACLVIALGGAREVGLRRAARAPEAVAARAARADLALGLRWLRAGTPSAGSWNHPLAPQAGGVLACADAAGWIAWHARRRAELAPAALAAPGRAAVDPSSALWIAETSVCGEAPAGAPAGAGVLLFERAPTLAIYARTGAADSAGPAARLVPR